MIPAWCWVILMYASGLVLVLAEFIVPGLICGILGTALIICSGVYGCMQYPDSTALIILAELLGVTIGVMAGMYLLVKTRAAKNLILTTSQAGTAAAESDTRLLGVEGTALTALRPAGTILIDNKRVDAVSDGSFIEENSLIRVIEVQGSRVVVEQLNK